MMRVRAVQFSPALGNVASNLGFHLETVARARADKIDLVVFPELSLSGYLLQDIVYDLHLTEGSAEIRALIDASRDIDILLGSPLESPPGIPYNCALYLSGGKILHCHRKVDLPNFGIFEERMIFKPGESFLAFQRGDFRIGILICREILFPQNSYLYHLQNCDLLIGISNSPFRSVLESSFPSTRLWESMGFVISHFYQAHYLFVNRCGEEDGMIFGGGSFYAAPGIGIKQLAPYFEEAVFDIEIDIGAVRRARLSANYLRDQQPRVIAREMKRILGHDAAD